MKTATPAEEIIELAGERWVRVPGTMDGLRSADENRPAKYCREDSLRRAIQERAAEQRKLSAFSREAEQARTRLEAMPVETIADVQWRQHPDHPELLVTVETGTALTRQRVAQIAQDRAEQAARDQRRDDLHAAVSPAPLAARLAELERQLAEARGK